MGDTRVSTPSPSLRSSNGDKLKNVRRRSSLRGREKEHALASMVRGGLRDLRSRLRKGQPLKDPGRLSSKHKQQQMPVPHMGVTLMSPRDRKRQCGRVQEGVKGQKGRNTGNVSG